jgi:hypothetical protein
MLRNQRDLCVVGKHLVRGKIEPEVTTDLRLMRRSDPEPGPFFEASNQEIQSRQHLDFPQRRPFRMSFGDDGGQKQTNKETKEITNNELNQRRNKAIKKQTNESIHKSVNE